MNNARPTVEIRRVNSPKDVTLNIARDLKRRTEAGKALVVIERPIIALSLIRKRWAQLVRELNVARASTLKRWRREELSLQQTRMEWTEFTATDYESFADVYVAEPSKAAELVDQVATVYVATPLSDSELKALLHKAEPDTVVIRYEFDAKPD